MPTKSAAQHRLMEAAAHTEGGYDGVPQSVGQEFVGKDATTIADELSKRLDALTAKEVEKRRTSRTDATQDQDRESFSKGEHVEVTADGEIRYGVVAGIKREEDETTVVVAIELEPGEVKTYTFPEDKVRKAIADARADTSAPEVFSFNFVNARMAIGAGIGNHQDRVDQLKAVGLNVVVNCQAEYDDTPLLVANDLAVIDVGTDDDSEKKPKAWFESIILFSLAALQHPGAKLFFHCYNGHNRSASACYVVLRALGHSPEVAEKMIRDTRPGVTMRYMRDADEAIKELGYE